MCFCPTGRNRGTHLNLSRRTCFPALKGSELRGHSSDRSDGLTKSRWLDYNQVLLPRCVASAGCQGPLHTEGPHAWLRASLLPP